MRRARITYKGAYHHAMNRGHEGKCIFSKDREKEFFLKLLVETSKILKIRILAFCLMNNHYHLVLENSSGRMSDFFKQLNGQFGSHYRQNNKGRGYVFQDRYKSMLIQDDSYLLMVIGYVLNNPVRAGLVNNFLNYKWSSANLYFIKELSEIVDVSFVEEMFGTSLNLSNFTSSLNIKELPTIQTRMGKIIGGEGFTIKAIENFNRRKSHKRSLESKRIDDFDFDPVKKVFYEFKKIHNIEADNLDTTTYYGKRLRGNLLVYLKEKAGLKYDEIIKFTIFSDIKLHSLGRTYKDAKKRMLKYK